VAAYYNSSMIQDLSINSVLEAQVAAGWSSLHELLSRRHKVIPYSSSTSIDCWDALRVLDKSPANVSMVRLIYAQKDVLGSKYGTSTSWNREHVWPKSFGVGYSGPDTSDLHSLRASDWNINSARGNLVYGNCDSCESPAHVEADPTTAKNSVEFRPPALARGDLARSLFYMALRYGVNPFANDSAVVESGTERLALSDCPCKYTYTMGILSDLIQWHREDPPSTQEIERNSILCEDFQGNRNPFIDFPGLVSVFFPTPPASQSATCPSCSAPSTSDDNSEGSPTNGSADSIDGLSRSEQAAKTLGEGPIAFLGFNSDNPDSFTFVALSTLPAHLPIVVTDGGWTGTDIRGNEGHVTWTNGDDDVLPGTIITWISDSSATTPTSSTSSSPVWTWTHTTGFSLSAAGDQILSYVEYPEATAAGTAAADPTITTTAPERELQTQTRVKKFLCAIQFASSGAWDEEGSQEGAGIHRVLWPARVCMHYKPKGAIATNCCKQCRRANVMWWGWGVIHVLL
jgi:endonuclease I